MREIKLRIKLSDKSSQDGIQDACVEIVLARKVKEENLLL